MADAIALELASYDASRREWFLAVPVGFDIRRAVEKALVEPEPIAMPVTRHGSRPRKARQPSQSSAQSRVRTKKGATA